MREPLLDGDHHLPLGEMRPETPVMSDAEGDVRIDLAAEVDLLGILEDRRIPVHDIVGEHDPIEIAISLDYILIIQEDPVPAVAARIEDARRPAADEIAPDLGRVLIPRRNVFSPPTL